MMIKFGDSNLIKKIINNSDRVKLLIRKMLEEGLSSTFNKVQNKLNKPIELGYSTCAEVIQTTSNKLKKGDLVVTNAPHSDYSIIKNNLCIKIKNKSIDKRNLAFAFLSSISINAFKISKIKKNENAAVIGLGVIGLILAKYLKSEKNYIKTYDINKNIVNKYQSELNTFHINRNLSNLESNDINSFNVVYLCVENISSSLLYTSCEMLKNNGTVVIIGTTKAIFPRDIIYKKSLKIRVAVSYGPGRYDETFEKGLDQNYIKKFNYSYLDNIESFIHKISNKFIDLSNLNFADYNFDNYQEAYNLLKKNKVSGIIFSYSKNKKIKDEIVVQTNPKIQKKRKFSCDIIGSGNHASNIIIPSILSYKESNIVNLVSKNGISNHFINNKLNLNANIISLDKLYNKSYNDNYLFILTNHDSHSEFLYKFFSKRKKIFLEKPLCETLSDLSKIKKLVLSNYKKLHINYNRRYSNHTYKIKDYIKNSTVIDYNIYSNSFTFEKKDLNSVKSILIGEMCHFVDFCQFLINKKIIRHEVYFQNYNIFLKLFFKDESIANINYFSIENNNLSKENIIIHSGDTKIILENFRDLKILCKNSKYHYNSKKIDKGFKESIFYFFNNEHDKNYVNQIIENSKITIKSFIHIKNEKFN